MSETATQSVQSPNRKKVRSKNGCLTCRIRKVKCDERRPVCQRCTNRPVKCEWLEPGKPLSLRRARSWKKSILGPDASQRPLAILKPSPASSEDSQLDDAQTEIMHQVQQAPQPTLSTSHIPLSNSLQLSVHDQAAFLYIPDSILVLSYGKLWQWSCFSYIYTNIASQYPGVMRSFIAVASMELRSREILAAQDGHDPTQSRERAQRIGVAATAHYSLALKDLSSLLDRICHSEGPSRSNDIDALFAMWFLILRFEAYDSESTGSSLVHLDGIRSFLRPYLQNDGYVNGETLPYVSQPMLLYTLYLDADSATGNINGGRFCLDLLSRDDNDLISHESIFRSARSLLPKIWGEAYPVAEFLDDLENYRPLRLHHLCQAAKLELLRLARSERQDREEADNLRKLWQRVQNFGDEFTDILLLAKMAPNSLGKRLMWTVYSSTLDFHALQVLYSYLYPGEERQPHADSTLTHILAIASKALGEDARQIYRFMWALSVALTLCKSEDQDHEGQEWLTTQLDRARVLMPNFGVPGLNLLNKSNTLQI
ncbi:hypothetical protein B0T10DRAFT_608870 [Thelonectria olida]|uniref:Zn(2)-C6 fungal-type domain-containing protein n=1 Tax=Thelonectria olida TaxID=1576542 RepID=A0A9P8VXV4_9HYPO|nr:hypothetical protein B0T10DRAFT_608870 [Thelonectria olida]